MNDRTQPAETLICPGHGLLMTVAEEKEHNPFFWFPVVKFTAMRRGRT
jgi:hypothetical protein